MAHYGCYCQSDENRFLSIVYPLNAASANSDIEQRPSPILYNRNVQFILYVSFVCPGCVPELMMPKRKYGRALLPTLKCALLRRTPAQTRLPRRECEYPPGGHHHREHCARIKDGTQFMSAHRRPNVYNVGRRVCVCTFVCPFRCAHKSPGRRRA